jgi:hypothetical protein
MTVLETRLRARDAVAAGQRPRTASPLARRRRMRSEAVVSAYIHDTLAVSRSDPRDGSRIGLFQRDASNMVRDGAGNASAQASTR